MFRRNVAGQNLYFVMINATTGAVVTGASVTGQRTIVATQATVTGTISEIGGGQYRLAMSAADTDGDSVGYLFTATSCLPYAPTAIMTQANPTDGVGFGLSRFDAAVSSRMATYTQPTGFLAATFPGGTLSNTTNQTAGTVTTATNLTNLPTIPANWLTAAGINAGAITAAKFGAGAIDATAIAANAIGSSQLAATAADEVANALLDLTDGVETSLTLRQAIRLILSAAAGKLSGAATSTVTIRNVGDTKARITATVDADGNRSAVTTDGT